MLLIFMRGFLLLQKMYFKTIITNHNIMSNKIIMSNDITEYELYEKDDYGTWNASLTLPS